MVGMFIIRSPNIAHRPGYAMPNSLLILLILVPVVDARTEPDMIIEKNYELPYPPDVVYAAWVSSDTVIPPATAMDIDPVIGGHYRLIMESPDFTSKNEGQFLSVDPGRHVRYTWEWNGDGEVSEIDVTFSAIDAGTHISLIHRGFSKQESLDTHNSGWDSYIEGFATFLGKQN